jgi:hypothetical protein
LYPLSEERQTVELEANKASESQVFLRQRQIDSGDIIIRYCQTENMRADFFTKALQGSRFRKHHDFILNVAPAYYDADHRSVLESVGRAANMELAGEGRTDVAHVPTDVAHVPTDVARDPTPYRTSKKLA